MPIMKEITKAGYSFAVYGGEFVSDGSEDRYRFFFKKLAEVRGKTPFYCVPGNHDVFDYADNADIVWRTSGGSHRFF
jgi:3',5'-cyclic AMP phosphodiesterase CpdA